jgi:hypothetical protein
MVNVTLTVKIINKKQKFENFLESLKDGKQDILIESVKNGFNVCYENEMQLGHYITSTYETWDEESLEIGETDDKGWLDAEGESMEPDNFDIEEGKDVITNTVEFLSDKGAIHPSDSVGAGWWSTEGDIDIQTGDRTTESYHLNNYTDEEKQEIQKRMG